MKDVRHDAVDEMIEPVGRVLVERRREDDVGSLEFEFRFEKGNSTALLRIGVVEQKRERTVNRVEKSVDDQFVQVLDVTSPDARRFVGLKEGEILGDESMNVLARRRDDRIASAKSGFSIVQGERRVLFAVLSFEERRLGPLGHPLKHAVDVVLCRLDALLQVVD